MLEGDQRLHEEPEVYQPANRKTNMFSRWPIFNASCTAVSSATLQWLKRSASVAGMDNSAVTSGIKRRRVGVDVIKDTMSDLAAQNDMYAAEKFSNSFGISHVLNSFVESEYVAHVCCSVK